MSANGDIPSTIKVVIVWLLIGTAVFLGWQWYEREQLKPSIVSGNGLGAESLVIERGRDGHYHLLVQVNGIDTPFMLDTGATQSAVSSDFARKANIVTSSSAIFNTANGAVRGDIGRANIALPNQLMRIDGLPISILENLDGPSLLGMDVLGKLKMVQEGKRLTLSRR